MNANPHCPVHGRSQARSSRSVPPPRCTGCTRRLRAIARLVARRQSVASPVRRPGSSRQRPRCATWASAASEVASVVVRTRRPRGRHPPSHRSRCLAFRVRALSRALGRFESSNPSFPRTQRRKPCMSGTMWSIPTATPSASRSRSASAGTSTRTSSAAAASTSARSSCPTGCRRSASSPFLTPEREAVLLADPGAHLRQHLRPRRALHRGQGPRGEPRALARRPGCARGAGALHRRGTEAPGAVPAGGEEWPARACRRATGSCRSPTRSRRPCLARPPGRCWDSRSTSSCSRSCTTARASIPIRTCPSCGRTSSCSTGRRSRSTPSWTRWSGCARTRS